MKIIMPLLFASCLCFSGASAKATPQTQNYEAEGNLESTHAPGCIAPTDIRNSYTPADLYEAVADCVLKGQPAYGVALYVVAGAYSKYDVIRVRDASAHDAPLLLRSTAFQRVGDEKTQAFKQTLLATLKDDAQHSQLCTLLLHVGPPNYFPRYMTQHGMDAFIHEDEPALMPDLHPAQAWLKIMDSYLKCPASIQR